MKFYELEEEKLKIFLNAVPYDILREPFIKSKELKKQIKGFRIKKIPHSKLVSVSYSIIKKKKNKMFISYLDGFYNQCIDDINNEKKTLIQTGYIEDEAEALVIAKLLNVDFRPVLYKLEEFSDEKIKYLESKIREKKSLNLFVDERINVNNKKIEEIIKSYVDKIKELNKTIINQNKTINDLQIQLNKVTVEINKNTNKLESSFKQDNSKELEKSMYSITKEMDSLSKKMNIYNAEIKNQMVYKKDIESLNKRIDKIEKINVELLENQNFDVMEDTSTLIDDIGDAIFNFVPNDLFSTFREFIIESLYSSKPIIADRKNSLKLAKIYSTILTGGNINTVNIGTKDINIIELISKIKTIISDNSVIVLRGYFGCFDLGRLSEIMKESKNSILIIESNYAKEFKFLPLETVKDFIIFDYKLRDGNIDYYYKYNLDNRKAITNSLFDMELNAIGYHFKGFKIYNENFEGLFSFCFIPFKSCIDEIDKETLVNLLVDPNLRKKCEAITHE